MGNYDDYRTITRNSVVKYEIRILFILKSNHYSFNYTLQYYPLFVCLSSSLEAVNNNITSLVQVSSRSVNTTTGHSKPLIPSQTLLSRIFT